MRRQAPSPDSATVSRDTVHVTVELRLTAATLTGHAVGADGAVREFAGWLGLMAALEALVPEAESPPEDPDTIDRKEQ